MKPRELVCKLPLWASEWLQSRKKALQFSIGNCLIWQKNVTSNFPKENWEILGNWEIFLSCLWSILKPEKARQRCAVPLRPSESLLEVTGAQSWREQVAKNKTLFSTNQQGLRTNRQGQECPTCTLLIILGFLC